MPPTGSVADTGTPTTPPAAPPAVRPAISRLTRGALRTILPFIPIIVVWQAVVAAQLWPRYLFPGPLDVAAAGWSGLLDGSLPGHIGASMLNLLGGFLIGAALAIPLGLLMGVSRRVADLCDPVINLLQAIPGLAWIPLAILWFGLGPGAVLFIIVMSAFFPLLFNTLGGVRASEEVLVHASRTLGASRAAVVWHILVPSALPSMITGARLAFGYGFRALVGGEMIAATTGLGFMIFDARRYLSSDLVVLGMLTMGVIWLLIDRIVLKPLERRTVERWGMLR